MRTFLLIAPYFAPQTAVGAYRWVKLARHLARHDFRAVVLCGTFPDDSRDPDLLSRLPATVVTVDEYLDPRILYLRRALANGRARMQSAAKSAANLRPLEGLRPMHLLIDRYFVHGLHARSAAKKLAKQYDAKAIVVSAGPFSAVPVAFHAGRALGLPVVLDFRDPYALHESGDEAPSGLGDRLRRHIVESAEASWMKSAAHVVLNSRNTLDAYIERYPFLAEKSSFIRNHYDLESYDPVVDAPPPPRFTILHTGTLRSETRLDDIAAALLRLIDQEKLGPSDIVLRQIGRITDYERAQIADLGLSNFIEVVPTIPQRAMLSELRRGHVLLSMVDPRVRLRIAAKTYDYIASGMPIVSITENVEVDELLAHRPDNVRLRPGDVDGLVRVLHEHLIRFRTTRALPAPVQPPHEFSSAMAAERFANVLRNVL